MAFVVNDRVWETTTTTGTGDITLAGAQSGYVTFAAGIGASNATFYVIDNDDTEWEVGIGTLDGAGTTLTRTTVLRSSNSGSLVNFSSGTKQVFVDIASQHRMFMDNADTVRLTGSGSDALAGPILELLRDSSSPADSDQIGKLLFSGKNSVDADTDYIYAQAIIDDVTDATEDARLNWYVMRAGAETLAQSLAYYGIEHYLTTYLYEEVFLVDGDASAAAGPNLYLRRNSASPADADAQGKIVFQGRNDVAEYVQNASIKTGGNDVTDGTEDGYLTFSTIVNGSEVDYLTMAWGSIYSYRSWHQYDDVTIYETDDSATKNPQLSLSRNSASPAADDVLGWINFRGKNSVDSYESYGSIHARILDPTNGSEDGAVEILSMIAGTAGPQFYVHDGVKVGAPTGGYKGSGSLNAEEIYLDGTAVTDTATISITTSTSDPSGGSDGDIWFKVAS